MSKNIVWALVIGLVLSCVILMYRQLDKENEKAEGRVPERREHPRYDEFDWKEPDFQNINGKYVLTEFSYVLFLENGRWTGSNQVYKVSDLLTALAQDNWLLKWTDGRHFLMEQSQPGRAFIYQSVAVKR